MNMLSSFLPENQLAPGRCFWSSLHPLVFLAYLALVVAVSVMSSHPLVLGILLGAVLASLASAGSFQAWKGSVKIFLWMIVILMVVNTLVNQSGATVLLTGPWSIRVTLENLAFSVVMGVRLLVIYSVFILFNQAMDQDRLLSFFARIFPRSAIMAAMATRSIPVMGERLRRSYEIQRLRGVPMQAGGRLERIKNRLPLMKVLVMSSLEDSFNMGESIQARAYGSGPRTTYRQEAPQGKDFMMAAAMSMALMVFIYIFVQGWGSMQFFPFLEVEGLASAQSIIFVLLALLLCLPALLAWGWNRWNYFKWKI